VEGNWQHKGNKQKRKEKEKTTTTKKPHTPGHTNI